LKTQGKIKNCDGLKNYWGFQRGGGLKKSWRELKRLWEASAPKPPPSDFYAYGIVIHIHKLPLNH